VHRDRSGRRSEQGRSAQETRRRLPPAVVEPGHRGLPTGDQLTPMRFGVVVFPGSNCDHDAFYVLRHVLYQDVRYLWHKDQFGDDVDCVVLPGGFSYGDYLRTG